MMEQQTILLVEDDPNILLSNREFLSRRGYAMLAATTLAEAERVLKNHSPNLILLDIHLPDGSGLDFISRFRNPSYELCAMNYELPTVPVIFLTCRADSADIVEGLTRGGCDYITKPYDLNVLAARIEAQLRQTGLREIVTRKSLTLNGLSQQAFLSGVDMMLTQKEFAILLLLAQNEGRTLTKDYVYEKAWGQPLLADDAALFKQMSRLKKKLEQGQGLELIAMRGEGYCLTISR